MRSAIEFGWLRRGIAVEGRHAPLRSHPPVKESFAMPILFSYGTLQHKDVQILTFGRVVSGQSDELPRFEPSLLKIENPHVVAASGETHYANVTFNGRADSHVSGTVFEITDAELAEADEYEREGKYERVAVTLASGRQAWVYVAGGPGQEKRESTES
jgi:gamma-glutamylcyclotransferase (GGCT)/AIG2-like uncharacterized protein YtfP